MRQAMTNTEDHAWSQKPMQLASEDTARSMADTEDHAGVRNQGTVSF